MSTPYPPPLDQLLALGQPEFGHRKPWPDYLAMGFTDAHVPELIRLAGDAELGYGSAEEARTYAPIHAWRTLGLLRAEAAIEPLLPLLEEDDDWAGEEIPSVLARIGPAALEPLRAVMARWSLEPEPWPAGAAAGGLVEIAQRFPETRETVVGVLTRQLRWWGRHEPILNTMLIDGLVELKAVEAAPLMEEVFAAGAADTQLGGDWEDAQVALGLLAERVTPRRRYVPPPRLRPTPDGRPPTPPAANGARQRRKAEKAARRRNRKRR